MPNPLFSIIIPTYNRADFVTKTIESLLNQTYTNFEIIVVDDGSTDNTMEVVIAITDSRISYYKKENAERGAARNFGTKKAKGEYINFFDSDDLAYPNHLETALEVIKENHHPSIFALHYDIKDTNNQILRVGTPFKNINSQLMHGNLLSCNGVFVKKEVALKHPFSEIRELSASEDYLLWLQLAARYPFSYSNQKTSIIIEHDTRSVISFNKKHADNRINYLYKSLTADSVFISKFGIKAIHQINAHMLSYFSLHAGLDGNKQDSYRYLKASLKKSILEIFSKRFLVILKLLVTK